MLVNTTVDGAVRLLDCQEKLAVGAVDCVLLESELLLHPNNNKQETMTEAKTLNVFIINDLLALVPSGGFLNKNSVEQKPRLKERYW